MLTIVSKILGRFAAIACILAAFTVSFAEYTVSYSGGSCTVTSGSPGGAYRTQNGLYGYGGSGMGVSCTGKITATFTWQGSTPAPPKAIVRQQCVASGNAIYGTVSADNGLGDSAVLISPPLSIVTEMVSGKSGLISLDHYSVETGGDSFSVECEPSLSASGVAGGGSVWYQAAAEPLSISFTDGNGTQVVGNLRHYLIGQNVQAQVQSSLTPSGQTWTTSGGTPFASYVASADSAVLTPLASPYNSTTFSGYYATEDNVSLTCSGTLAVPSGALPAAGIPFSVTGQFSTLQPDFSEVGSAVGSQGGTPNSTNPPQPTSVSCFGLTFLDPQYSPPINRYVGVYFHAKLNSVGNFKWIQLVNLGRNRSKTSGSQTMKIPLGTTPETYAISGLDSVFPASPSAEAVPAGFYGAGTRFYDADGPLQAFEDPTVWSTYTINSESFSTYLLYQPPGTNSMYVPIFRWNWEWSCSATRTSSVWSAPISTMTGADEATLPMVAHPTWTRRISIGNAIWVNN